MEHSKLGVVVATRRASWRTAITAELALNMLLLVSYNSSQIFSLFPSVYSLRPNSFNKKGKYRVGEPAVS